MSAPSKAANARRKYTRAYRRTGFHALVAATRRDGLSALDGRSTQARAIKLWKAQVAADLGGALSAQQLTLLDIGGVDMALLACADAWLKENAGQVVNRRKKTFVPLVAERLRVASHVVEILRALGLERRARDVPALAEYVRSRAAASRAPDAAHDAPLGAGPHDV